MLGFRAYNVPSYTYRDDASVSTLTTPVAATPEPSSLVLLGTDALGIAGTLRRRYITHPAGAQQQTIKARH